MGENDPHTKPPTHLRKQKLGTLGAKSEPTVLVPSFSSGHSQQLRQPAPQRSPLVWLSSQEKGTSLLRPQTAEAAPFPWALGIYFNLHFSFWRPVTEDVCELIQIKENKDLVLKHMFESINWTISWMYGKCKCCFLFPLPPGLWVQGSLRMAGMSIRGFLFFPPLTLLFFPDYNLHLKTFPMI